MWHWGENSLEGSEHYLDGVQQPMEVQLFHWNTKYTDYTAAAKNSDGLAAVSFFYEVSSADNPAISGQLKVLGQLIEALEQDDGGSAQQNFTQNAVYDTFPTSSLSQLLPTGGLDVSDNYFYYNGSLTLPNTTILTTTNMFVDAISNQSAVISNSNSKCRQQTIWQYEGKGSKKRKTNSFGCMIGGGIKVLGQWGSIVSFGNLTATALP